jgi:hypothetical protein
MSTSTFGEVIAYPTRAALSRPLLTPGHKGGKVVIESIGDKGSSQVKAMEDHMWNEPSYKKGLSMVKSQQPCDHPPTPTPVDIKEAAINYARMLVEEAETRLLQATVQGPLKASQAEIKPSFHPQSNKSRSSVTREENDERRSRRTGAYARLTAASRKPPGAIQVAKGERGNNDLDDLRAGSYEREKMIGSSIGNHGGKSVQQSQHK